MSRHHDRERSRDHDRYGGYRGRSESSDSYEKKKRSSHRSSHTHNNNSVPPAKRVKFNDVPDIKVFRKEDEPSSKGLSDTDIEEYMKKIESEKGSNSFNSMSWETMKHKDAQLENNSIKEQKEKEKILQQKLLAVREEIPFYVPLPLPLKEKNGFVVGEGSTEKGALSTRLENVLGCFYVQESEIPNEPTFQIQNKSTSVSPKLISFDKQRINDKNLTTKKNEKKDQKPLKGILKGATAEVKTQASENEPRRIDPNLIYLLKEIQNNKAEYPKQKVQILLKPYKDSGQLDYLKNNPKILASLMRSASMPPQQQIQRSSISPGRADPYNRVRYSISPQAERPPGMYMGQNDQFNQYRPPAQYGYPQSPPQPPQPGYNQFGQYPPFQPPPINSMPPQYHPLPNVNNFPPPPTQGTAPSGSFSSFQNNPQMFMNRNYKTVPCKYYHSPQGCVKATNCTFIHHQEYAGRPSPEMMKSNRGLVMVGANYTPDGQYNYQNEYGQQQQR